MLSMKQVTQAFLSILGRSKDDLACRVIAKGEKGFAKKCSFDEAEQYEGKADVYVIPNPGGHYDKDITHAICAFAEHDDLALNDFPDFDPQTATVEEYIEYSRLNKKRSIELVGALIKEGKLPQPTMAVDTGGKSVHWYWKFSDECPTDRWKLIQQRLIGLLKSDESLVNPSRLMRLPGMPHLKTGVESHIKKVWKTGPEDDFFAEPIAYASEELLNALPPTEEELRVAAGKERQQEWLDAQPQAKRAPKSKATFRFFENLAPTEKYACAVEMLQAISRRHGREEEGGYVPNNIQEQFIFGLFREFQNLKDEDQLKMLEKGFGAWNSASHAEGKLFNNWRKGVLAKGHGQGIGTVIKFAKECGWVSKEWEKIAGKDEASMIGQIVDDHLYGAEEYTYWNETFYRREEGDFHYTPLSVVKIRQQIDDIIVEHFSKSVGSATIDKVIEYLKDRRTPVDPDLVNPDGWLLVKNGVLRISPEEIKLYGYDAPEVEDFRFLDAPRFAYKPDMDTTEADKLWECWGEGESLDLVQRIFGTALNIQAIRNRGIRTPGLFALGEGQNGKGMWEDILRAIFGASATSGVPLQEMHQHSQDMHRAYQMPQLIGSRVNFPSENPCAFLLDKCETFRQVITGERTQVRRIREDMTPLEARCINIFPLNDAALLNNKKANTRSRVRAVNMPYVYTDRPDPSDPCQRPLDPRYVIDNPQYQTFWSEELLPGILLRMIEGWRRALADGYPNKLSDSVIQEMKQGANPFEEFMEYSTIQVHHTRKWQVTLTGLMNVYRHWIVDTERGEVKGNTHRLFIDNPHLPANRDALVKRLKDFKIEIVRPTPAMRRDLDLEDSFYCANITIEDKDKLVFGDPGLEVYGG